MDFATGDFGVGGGEVGAALFTFRGDLGAPFVRFVQTRAARLSLGGWATEGNDVEVLVAGPTALIDMFEMACSLGPYDTFVETWERSAAASDTPPPRPAVRW